MKAKKGYIYNWDILIFTIKILKWMNIEHQLYSIFLHKNYISYRLYNDFFDIHNNKNTFLMINDL